MWSSLRHNDEREAAFEGGRPVDGAIGGVVLVAVVAIAVGVALRVAGLVRLFDVFGELAQYVVRNSQLTKWIPCWRLEWGNGGW